VRIARRLIAAEGLEGLRTRHVAEQAGIDTGTLHYHFPSKEDLVRAVVESLVADFQTNRAAPRGRAKGPLEELRQEFVDAALRIKASPEQIRVMAELRIRSYRDPAIADILAAVDRAWSDHLASRIARGQEDGVFRRDVDAGTAAAVIRTEIEGVAIRGLADPSHIEGIATALYQQLVTWLAPSTGRQSTKRTRHGRR
jgi:AcrR family transcriptional regulator